MIYDNIIIIIKSELLTTYYNIINITFTELQSNQLYVKNTGLRHFHVDDEMP